MKKLHLLGLILLILVLLASCAEERDAAAYDAGTKLPKADIGGTMLAYDVTELDLTALAHEFDQLVAAGEHLEKVTHIDLGVTDLTREQVDALQAAYPNAQIDYSIALLGQTLAKDTQYLDASAMAVDQTDSLVAALPMLPGLQEINFVSEDGVCVYTVENIAELDKIRQALPEALLRVRFELFGQTVTSEDERIEYYRVEIGNEGVEDIRAVLPYLSACTYFLMDGCGVDDEVMAQLRADFPETKVVWRVWLVEPNYNSPKTLRAGSFLTDTHRVRTTYVHDKNAYLLNYCVETKYLDIGHVGHLTVCDFLAYMPDLEVCIIAITGITDITPLANHEKLEYLELFTTDIADLSPLASCPNIEHLNISNMPNVSDITPLYGLTKLKRLRMVSCPLIPEEQKAEIEALLPEGTILKNGIYATSWFWRYDENGEKVERYALLCEQMEYEIDAYKYGIP